MSSINTQGVAGMLERWDRDVDSGYGDQRLSGERYSESAKTGEWMVRITSSDGGVLTTSNNEQFSEYCRSMTNPNFSITRRTNANVVDSNKYDSARVRVSNLLFAIPHDVWTPVLESHTIQGTILTKIEFIRLTNQGQLDEIAENVNFDNALIQQIKQVGDIVLLCVRVNGVERIVAQHSQAGTPGGQNAFSYNIGGSVITMGDGGDGDDAGGDEGGDAGGDDAGGEEV